MTSRAGFGAAEGRNWLFRHLSSGIAVAENLLADAWTGPYCFGASPTVADCVLFAHVRAAWRWGIDARGVRRVSAVYARCADNPAFAAAIESPDQSEPI